MLDFRGRNIFLLVVERTSFYLKNKNTIRCKFSLDFIYAKAFFAIIPVYTELLFYPVASDKAKPRIA
jgi:hypothetical protein